jgi:hypothetical protein
MFVQTIDFEIKVILKVNLNSSPVYRKYNELILSTRENDNIKHIANYSLSNGRITCFELKRLIREILKKVYGDSVHNYRNKLFIRKMFICQKEEDLAIFSDDLVKNIETRVVCGLIKKK